MTCSYCNHQINASDKFCPNCGREHKESISGRSFLSLLKNSRKVVAAICLVLVIITTFILITSNKKSNPLDSHETTTLSSTNNSYADQLYSSLEPSDFPEAVSEGDLKKVDPIPSQIPSDPTNVIKQFIQAVVVRDIDVISNLVSDSKREYYLHKSKEEIADDLKDIQNRIPNLQAVQISSDQQNGSEGTWRIDTSTEASPQYPLYVNLVSENGSWKLLSIEGYPEFLGPDITIDPSLAPNSSQQADPTPAQTSNQTVHVEQIAGIWASEQDANKITYTIVLNPSGTYMGMKMSEKGSSTPGTYGSYKLITEANQQKLLLTSVNDQSATYEITILHDGLITLEQVDNDMLFTQIEHFNNSPANTEPSTTLDETSLEPSNFLEAVSEGDLKKVESYLNQGMDVNVQNEKGVTALMVAAINNDRQLAQLFIKKGAMVDQKTHMGATALSFTAMEGSEYVAEELLKNGANVNVQETDKGDTPIMIAIKERRLNLVKLLYRYDADLQLKNKQGVTAIDLALGIDDQDINAYLGVDEIYGKVKYSSLNEFESFPAAVFDSDVSDLDDMYHSLTGKWTGKNELGEDMTFEFTEDKEFTLAASTSGTKIKGTFYLSNYDNVLQMWVGQPDKMSLEVRRIKLENSDAMSFTDRLGYVTKLSRAK